LAVNGSFKYQKVSCIAELDCLASLAYLGNQMDIKCKPVMLNQQEKVFKLNQMVHPCI
jgi:DNA mismatch repair ATPase MutS